MTMSEQADRNNALRDRMQSRMSLVDAAGRLNDQKRWQIGLDLIRMARELPPELDYCPELEEDNEL